jgi:O-antigen/teichoic acid export membrane protein
LWQRGGTLACGLAALAWKPDVTVLAIAMLVPVALTLAVSLQIASRITGGRPDQPSPERPWSADASAEAAGAHDYDSRADPQLHRWMVFRREVWPIGAGIVLSALYFRIDVFLVQWWAGTEPVAYYNAVFRLVEALRLFPAAVLAVVLPSLVRAGDLRPLARVALPITGFALVASAALWIAAGWLIPAIYGAPYAAAVPTFRVLVLSFPLLSLNFALTHQLVVWDGHRVYAGLCALALAINLALNARLIPLWSIEGAAWATLGTEVALTAGCGVALWSMRAPVHAPQLVTEA